MAEKIEGFYLNGTEYEIGGGAEYNAGQGISIGTAQDYSAMRGPAPDGFHVPSKDEWGALCEILTTTFSMAQNATTMGTYLKMPMAGNRNYSNASISGIGRYGLYWSSSPYDSGNAYILIFDSSYIKPQYNYRRAFGFPVRCFKDSFEVPTSSWTTLYDGSSVATGAGVFWNSTDGLISVSGDGQTWYTIQDKNLGATTVFNQGDTETDANCGYFYQWGNNYGFPHSGDVTTSSTQVDASNYGPGNYYSNSTFIKGSDNWSSVQNDNLWGATTGVVTLDTITNTGVLSVNGQTGDVTIQTGGNYTAGNGINIANDKIGLDGTYEGTYSDYSAMQGPAPDGFHVPTIDEWQGLKTIMNGLSLTTGDGWRINLHMPFAGYRGYSNADLNHQGSNGRYWSSSPWGSSHPSYARNLTLDSSGVYTNSDPMRAGGLPVRCFKNSYVAPKASWTVITGTLGSAGIFWNQTDGIISITSDGTTGYTMMDKNLGATTVYNNGDTLSQANMGNMYQWGNNYGFPSTGTISNTSSTQVDASSYGPGNYYSSSTFITGSFDWSSVYNDNLRGWVTGIQTSSTSGSLVLGDKLYKIVTSTTAPASGTASNIITIVTD